MPDRRPRDRRSASTDSSTAVNLRGQRRASLPRRRELLRRHARARRQELPHVRTVLARARRIGRGVRCHDLRPADGEPHLDHAGKIRHADVDDLCAQSVQHLERRFDSRGLAGVDAIQRILAIDADAHASNAPGKAPERVGGGGIERGRILRIASCDRIEHDGHVGDAPRHRPDVIERVGHRQHAVATHAAVRRLESDHAVGRRGVSNRASGVGTDSGVTQTRCRRDADPLDDMPGHRSGFHGLSGTSSAGL